MTGPTFAPASRPPHVDRPPGCCAAACGRTCAADYLRGQIGQAGAEYLVLDNATVQRHASSYRLLGRTESLKAEQPGYRRFLASAQFAFLLTRIFHLIDSQSASS